MRKKHLLFLFFICWALRLPAEEVTVKDYNYNGSFPIKAPLMVDPTDVNGKVFSMKDILESASLLQNLDYTGNPSGVRADGVTTTGKTDGITAPTGQAGQSVQLYSFYLYSDRYQKGQIEIKTDKDFALYIDRELQKPSNGKVNITLEPRHYEIAIQLLAKDNSENKFETILDFPEVQSIRTSLSRERYYTLSDVMEGKRIQGSTISPDGKYIVVEYAEVLPGGDRQSHSQVIDRSTGQVIMDLDGNRKSARWMPRTTALYYTRKGMQGKELVKLNPANNREEVLAMNLPEGNFRFSPVEDYLLFTIQEKGPKEREDIREVLVPDDRQPGWRDRSFIHKYDLKTGLMQRITFGYHTTSIHDISADGRYVLAGCRESFLTERPFSRTTLYRIDLQTMHTDTIFKAEKFISRAQFSPEAGQLLVSGSGDAFEGIGLNIKEGQISNTSDGQLFLYDLRDKNVTPLTRDFVPSVDHAVWNHFDNTIYVQAKDKDMVKLYTIHPVKKTIASFPVKEEVLTDFQLAALAPEMVYFGMSGSNSNRLYAQNTKRGAAACLVDLSAEILKNVRLGELNDWNFVSQDGDTIYGRYYLPPHFDPQKKYPLIVNYYGGTTPTARVLESRYPSHAYAALGYVVYIVQPSGATGFGQEFSARHVNAWGKQTADEIIEGAKKFCEAHPFINKEKIGCMGASYGGFMTMYLQTKTDIFAAAMSHAGISDITSYWGEGYWGYSYSALATADSYPWNARDIYVEQSPLFHADKINTPILFLHGFADTNVPVGESIQMFTALKLLGKETALVEVPGQDHHILDYNKRIRWQNSIFAWFDKWLKDQPEWWDALYPPKDL